MSIDLAFSAASQVGAPQRQQLAEASAGQAAWSYFRVVVCSSSFQMLTARMIRQDSLIYVIVGLWGYYSDIQQAPTRVCNQA